MENKLLDFYEKSLRIDLEIPESTILRYNEYLKKLDIGNSKQRLLYHIYSNTVNSLMSYRNGPVSDYFKTVNGVKLIETLNYTGVIDYWFPSEPNFFDLTRNPILSGFFVLEVMREGGFAEITDFSGLGDVEKESVLGGALNNLINALTGMEIWGFWMGDMRNSERKRRIKVRRFKIESVSVDSPLFTSHPYLDYFLSVTLIDQDTKEKKTGNWFGWNFYLSRSLLDQKLKEIEVLWMRNYDSRVKVLDGRISRKKKELKRLIKERTNFMNGITEYQEKIKGLLYGKTVRL